jgi:tetratricopeptide (TPR) repeat protein
MSVLRPFLFLVVVVSLCASAIAQAVPPPAPPSETSTGKTPDYTQEGYVIEKWHTTWSFENDGTGKREQYARIKVQSEAGVQQWGQVVFGYNSANERVEIPYVRVLKADGTTVTAAPDAVQDLSAPVEREAPVYTDYRQKHITVPGLRPGEVLEYDIVTVIHTPLAPRQFWMEHNFAKSGGIVLDEQLEVNVPRDRKVKLKTQLGYDPKITDANGQLSYVWTSSHRERDDKDKDKEKEKKKNAKKKKELESPAVQMTTFSSWEELGRWYGGLERDRRQPAPEIQAKAKELTAGKNNDLEKIGALYDFVAKNFRYISLSFGVGRYQPHAASDVLHNQYGDCKDKHTLLASLLEASGYHASSVLINSSRKLDPDVPSPSQFDHVISLVPLGKEEVWMDTTTEVAPFRLLSANIRKKQGLVIPANGEAPHLEETPADPPVPNTQDQELDGKVSELGKLNAHVKYVVRGDAELLMRTLFRRVPNADWQRFVTRMSAIAGLDGEVSDLKVSDPADTRQAFQFEYQIVAANFFDWSRKKFELALPMSQISLVEADEENTDADSDAIQFGSPAEFIFRTRLEFPAKYEVRSPLPFSMKRDYAQYQASYKMEGGVFTSERKLVTVSRELPAARVSDYVAFRRAVSADLSQRLSVDSTAAGTPTASPDLKGDDLNDAARAALERGNFQVAVDLLKRLIEAEPKHRTAWLSLGRAYMGLRQTDQAIAAFQKQTENNAYDEYGFNSLGWAYSTARKYDEATAAFQKALEINPLSEYAHAALGGLFAEIHQYDKAAGELEKAASIKPDNGYYQISLGDAYLNLGQDDKALAAFDRAIDISATPLVWNNIAYQLSLKKAHLDRAQQYAESAVAATAAALRNVSLDQLNERDLGLVSSLAAYWDTLGWVYFGRGDLEKAQKYISAAWALGQHADEGDHLGQIYEKQGRKDDAIRAYALALSAVRPDPAIRGRLAALVGSDAKVDAAVAKHKDELQQARTIKLGKFSQVGSADFFVLLGRSGSGVTVEGTKFISGDDKLKGLGEVVRTAKYDLTFPDDTPAKVLRRGTASCSTTGECTFVMVVPDDVHSVD